MPAARYTTLTLYRRLLRQARAYIESGFFVVMMPAISFTAREALTFEEHSVTIHMVFQSSHTEPHI